MQTTKNLGLFERFLRSDSGASAIEYGLISSLVAVAVIPGLGIMGGKLAGVFEAVSDGLDGQPPPVAAGGGTPAPPPPEQAPAPPS